MIGTLLRDKKNQVISPSSTYSPPKEVEDLTIKVKEDYRVGIDILTRSFKEFNDMSLTQRMNEDQSMYNAYTMAPTSNPDDAWRWNGVTASAHNKIIGMAAQYINPTLYPKSFAQNDKDEEDRLAAEVMDTLLRFNIDNSDYKLSYLYAIISALVNPVAYLHIDFIKCYQTIKEAQDNGDIIEKEVVDDLYSGFQFNNVPADEILITNPYQFHLQKQRFIIRRRFIDFDEAKGLYGKHKNFEYVQPGIKVFYSEETGMFYDQKDDQLGTLCEEVIYYNRKEDIEVPFINGIYMGKTKVKANIMRHRDNKNKPKYPYAKFGFHPIDEKRFYFYRSAIWNMANDINLRNKMEQMVMDGTFLRLFPPLFGIGTGKVDSNVIFPGAFTAVQQGSSVNPIQFGDLNAAYSALAEIEKKVDEDSQSKVMEGQLSQEQKTAYEIQRAETNARIQLSIFGVMVSQFIDEFGGLMVDDVIRYQSVGEATETLTGDVQMKFRTILLPNQTENGKKVSKQVRFKADLVGKMMTEDQQKKEEWRLLKEEGGMENDKRIFEVNPDYFQNLKFKIQIDPAELTPKNEDLERMRKERFYDKAIVNPFVKKKDVTRDFFVEPNAKGDSDKYMMSDEEVQQEQERAQQAMQAPGQEITPPTKTNSLAGLMK